jgi:glycosyltransferase involved in cell wall biosynthesis
VISICSVADVGIHPIENTCLNHFYCLPNKLFQYIQAGIPVLCSDFPEMRKIVNGYKVGEVFDVEDINNISNTINIFFEDMEKLMEYKNNCIKASATLNWNIEKIKLLDIYSQLLSTSN